MPHRVAFGATDRDEKLFTSEVIESTILAPPLVRTEVANSPQIINTDTQTNEASTTAVPTMSNFGGPDSLTSVTPDVLSNIPTSVGIIFNSALSSFIDSIMTLSHDTTSHTRNPENSFGWSTLETSPVTADTSNIEAQTQTVSETAGFTDNASPCSSYTETGGSQCSPQPNCAIRKASNPNYGGIIAGCVVGIVIIGMVAFAAVTYYRKRTGERKNDILLDNDVLEDNKSGAALLDPPMRAEDVDRAELERSNDGTTGLMSSKGVNSNDEKSISATLTVQRHQIPRSPSTGRASDGGKGDHTLYCSTFTAPTVRLAGLQCSESKSSSIYQPDRSPFIGSFPRYSTGNVIQDSIASSSRAPSYDKPRSLGRNALSAHKHASAASAASIAMSENIEDDDTDEQETFSIERARTTNIASVRRHSLTPRIVNIVAAAHRNSDEKGSQESALCRDESHFEHPSVHWRSRSKQRARSASPGKAMTRYTGSPTKLNNHFGIKTWKLGRDGSAPER